MKRFITIIAILFSCLALRAEEKVGMYHSSYFDVDYSIEAGYNSRNVLTVYVQVEGEHSSDKVFFNFDGGDIDYFVKALKLAKEKFVEWQDIAIKNNVTDMRKDLDISFPRTTIAWLGSKWWFSFNKRLSPEFVVSSEGDILFLITGKAVSSSNEYIDMKYYFALSRASDFDELIEALNIEKITEHFNKKQNVEDLFK